MNEEELKTNLWDKFWETSRDAEDGTRLRDWDKSVISKVSFFEGFQKGKLEQKKEELKFLISEYFVYLNIDGGFIRDKIVKRIKQLQKEIGEEKQDE